MTEEQNPIDSEIQLPSVEEPINLTEKYSFLSKDILDDQDKLNLFDSAIKHITQNYQNFDKLGRISGGFIAFKLLTLNILTQENYITIIDHFFNDLNTKYTVFVQSLTNLYSKSDKLRKFCNNYLLENNYGEQIHSIQQDCQDI